MRIVVKLFANIAERAGTRQVELELRDGATVGEVLEVLRQRWSKMTWNNGLMLAVNREYADAARALRDGDELAVIPPVSGG